MKSKHDSNSKESDKDGFIKRNNFVVMERTLMRVAK